MKDLIDLFRKVAEVRRAEPSGRTPQRAQTREVDAMQQVEISTEYIQLQQLLKLTGDAATGGAAKEMIAGGQVRLNGEVCTQRGKKIRDGDTVCFGNICLVVRQRVNTEQ